MTDFVLTDGNDTFPTPGIDVSGADRIRGLGGADLIRGGGGADEIDGGTGNDTLFGGAGNDTIDAGTLPLQDVLDGGADVDLVVLDYQNVINVATGLSVRVIAHFSTGSWATRVDGVNGVTVMNFEQMAITSGNADDVLVGGNGNDTLTSLGGTDRLYGGNGNDEIAKTYGVYDLRGGGGQDLLRIADVDRQQPGAALTFDARAAVGSIACGNSTSGSFREFERYAVSGTRAGDTIYLNDGSDFANGGVGRDLLDGQGGHDTLEGGAGIDTLFGGSGNDVLTAGEPAQSAAFLAEQLFGGDGHDTFTLNTALNVGATRTFAGLVVNGGGGSDSMEIVGQSEVMDLTGAALNSVEALTYSSSGFTGGVILHAAQFNMFDDFALNGFVRLASGGNLVANGDVFITEIVLFSGGQRIDLSASTKPFSDFGPRVTGGVGNDSMIGSARRDAFSASGGRDTLAGGAGADSLTGGSGADLLVGGADADTFVYLATGDSGPGAGVRDEIVDFTVNPAAGLTFVDRMNLSFIDAQAATATNDAFVFRGAAAFTAAGQVRAVQQGADTLVQMNTAGSGGAEMEVLLRNFTVATLSAADFLL